MAGAEVPIFRRIFGVKFLIIADTENNPQKAAHELNRIITEYGLNISVQKTESMTFKWRDPVRTKIVILTYLLYLLTYILTYFTYLLYLLTLLTLLTYILTLLIYILTYFTYFTYLLNYLLTYLLT